MQMELHHQEARSSRARDLGLQIHMLWLASCTKSRGARRCGGGYSRTGCAGDGTDGGTDDCSRTGAHLLGSCHSPQLLTSRKSNNDEAHNRTKAGVQAAEVSPWRCSTASARGWWKHVSRRLRLHSRTSLRVICQYKAHARTSPARVVNRRRQPRPTSPINRSGGLLSVFLSLCSPLTSALLP